MQVNDGVTLNLRTPNGGAGVRLLEKAVSASQAANSTAFDVDQLANALRSGLGSLPPSRRAIKLRFQI